MQENKHLLDGDDLCAESLLQKLKFLKGISFILDFPVQLWFFLFGV